MSALRRRSRWFSKFALIALPIALCARISAAQGDAIRRARDAVREKTLSIDALFGKEPPITTSIEDARDGVPSLDGFEPEWYSPLAEMPWGQDATILLVPGTYVLMSQGYCLKPGTFGPQVGDGYLHTEWKGPKADLIKRILQRHVEHQEIPQSQVQLILWAIITRADMTKLAPETQAAATKLLTSAELLDLVGYKLGIVPDALRQRVLQSAPAPVRQVLEAENEVRRLLTSGEVRYADLERTAVLTGVVPEGDATFIVPGGRWSYHPSGFFIRYLPNGYPLVRIDIYYPETFEIRRDASGKIISVTMPDGRKVERSDRSSSLVHLASRSPTVRASRLALLHDAMHNEDSNAREALVALAGADYLDLLELQKAIGTRWPVSRTDGTAASRSLLREATHAALARYLGLRHRTAITRGSMLERQLRPVRTANGYRYLIAPVASDESALVQKSGGGSGYQPSSGGGTSTGPRQRQAASGVPSSQSSNSQPKPKPAPKTPPLKQYGSPSPDNKNQNAMSTMKSLASGLSTAASPYKMVGAGMQQGINAASSISGGLGGPTRDDSNDGAPGTGNGHDRSTVQAPDAPVATIRVANWSPRTARIVRQQGSVPDYQTFARPRSIEFPEVVPDAKLTAEQAQTLNQLLRSTFEMAMTLEAATVARTRISAAAKARDVEWQFRQMRALVYLKRAAGLAMIEVARSLETLRSSAGPGLGITATEVQENLQSIATSGFEAPVVAVSRQLGISDAQRSELRQTLLNLDPGLTAARLSDQLDAVQDALYDYGAYLAGLPEVVPPWNQ